MNHFKLTIAYDGTTFVGWQRQATGESIQGLLERALATLDKQPVSVAGAGRTDAGVHALGQVASFSLARDIDVDTVRRALNAHLPPAVRVVDVAAVDNRFHARFSSVSKIYRYRIWNAEVLNPFERPYVWHVPSPPLDSAAMDDAAQQLVGTHEFSSFQSAGATTSTAERTLYSSLVWRGEVDLSRSTSGPTSVPLLTYEVHGTGFLKHMVRSIVGTLVEVGRGRRTPASMLDVLQKRSRACAGETAPAAGLFLVSVSYESPDL